MERLFLFIVAFAVSQLILFGGGWVVWALVNQLSLAFTGAGTTASVSFCGVLFGASIIARMALQIQGAREAPSIERVWQSFMSRD